MKGIVMPRVFFLKEIQRNQSERVMELYEGPVFIRRYFEKQRPNNQESDCNRLIPAMQQWRVLPTNDFSISIEYMDGNKILIEI